MPFKIQKRAALFILAAILISAFFHFRSPNIPDPDSLYHIRHAYILRTNGIFNTEFPWAYYSAIRTYAADLWYGFHLLLIPFTFGRNLFLNLKIAGVIFTSLLLLSFYRLGLRQKFSFPGFWPFLFFLAVPNALFQLFMVRPHVISLALSVLLLDFLVEGYFLPVFSASLAITFFHISFFWLAPGIAALFFLIRLLQKNGARKGFYGLLESVLGTAMGAILRPEPVLALKLVYIQVVKLLVEKQGALPLLFSRELAPLSFAALMKTAPVFLFLWLIAAGVFIWQIARKPVFQKTASQDQNLLLWASGILSLGFLLMTLFVARRSLMFWPAFGTIFIAGTYSFFPYKKFSQELFSYAIFISFLIAAPVAVYQNGISLSKNAAPPDYLKGSAEWLLNNANSGEIAFNAHWDNFSQLFFWNQKNYYIGGMDPIFQYVYSQKLYWKFHHISIDEYGNLTCGEMECRLDNLEDAYSVLKNDFSARYVLAEKRRNPNFHRWLELDPRFERKFNNNKESIFLVK